MSKEPWLEGDKGKGRGGSFSTGWGPRRDDDDPPRAGEESPAAPAKKKERWQDAPHDVEAEHEEAAEPAGPRPTTATSVGLGGDTSAGSGHA